MSPFVSSPDSDLVSIRLIRNISATSNFWLEITSKNAIDPQHEKKKTTR